MPGWINGIAWMNNISFSSTKPTAGDLDANGKLIIGRTGANPVAATLTTGTGITITNGAGSITIASTVTPVSWSNIGASQALANNNGYICGSGGAISLSLPASAAVGDIIEVALSGSTSWTITQGAGQQVRLGNVQTTAGIGGSLASTAQGDWITLICDVNGTHWIARTEQGSINVV